MYTEPIKNWFLFIEQPIQITLREPLVRVAMKPCICLYFWNIFSKLVSVCVTLYMAEVISC